VYQVKIISTNLEVQHKISSDDKINRCAFLCCGNLCGLPTNVLDLVLIGLLNIKIVHCVHYHSSILVSILTKCLTMILYKNNLDALLQNVGVVHWSPVHYNQWTHSKSNEIIWHTRTPFVVVMGQHGPFILKVGSTWMDLKIRSISSLQIYIPNPLN
jgi:hypothetical protein